MRTEGFRWLPLVSLHASAGPKKSMLGALGLVLGLLTAGCATIGQDEVGIKRTMGRLQPQVYGPGTYGVNPFTTKMMRLPVRTQNVEIALGLPSREGLTVESNISILYRIDGKRPHAVLSAAGPDYEREIILSIFRSAAADICSQFVAKDMHSGKRLVIEHAIRERMASLLHRRGFIIEAVLLKSIRLPSGLARAIEDRLEAEQDALRMQYVLERERKEAERKLLVAQGERDAQKVVSEGLSEEILRLRAIEAFQALARSPNTKVIITGGNGPILTLPADASSGPRPE